MTIIYEIAVRPPAGRIDEVRRWFGAGPAQAWRALPQLQGFDAYFPAQGGAKDPYVDDGVGPGVLCMLGFPDADALRTAIGGAAFSHSLAALPPEAAITAEPMQRKFYGVDGEARDATLQAAFSYVVRYHRPAEDERAFIENYVATHPTLLATLPKIRSVLCYFPVARELSWQDPNGLASPDYMIGNEVAFDTIADFNAAMACPIRHELRRHFREFPAFSGRNTHFPMDRTRLV
jgi:hypothetical protein